MQWIYNTHFLLSFIVLTSVIFIIILFIFYHKVLTINQNSNSNNEIIWMVILKIYKSPVMTTA